jgi:3-oxo-5alpha-steroid 4-dehydrogenase
MTSNADVAASDVRDAHEIRHWDREADVVVVGFGCAGACAAIEAAEAAADTLVHQRAGGGGGTSALAGGLIYLGGGTPVQEACGYRDTPDGMFTFLMAACGPAPDEAKVRVYCDESVAHFHGLEAHGVPFKRSFYPEPSMESPTDDCLVYSGGEDAHPFDKLTPPVPRAHKPQTPNAAGGFLMQRLIAATETAGAEVLTDARAETLVVERDGRVAGVVVRHDGREHVVRVRRGVVLAAGGFVHNDAMLSRHSPLLQRCNYRLGTDGDDGRAIRMAMGAGADVSRMHAGEVAVPITPPRRLVRGILVTTAGQRFINEDAYYGRVGQEGLFRHGGRMFLIVDTAIYERNLAGFEATFVEETVADLERVAGFPDGSLQSTVALYNRHATNGEDPLFHKHRQFLQPLTQAPCAAVDCATDKVVWATFTLGGLRTNPQSEVLRPEGQIIPGLYAAGRTTNGIAAEGYVSGISIGDGTFFGRAAGRNAAARR